MLGQRLTIVSGTLEKHNKNPNLQAPLTHCLISVVYVQIKSVPGGEGETAVSYHSIPQLLARSL